MSDLIHFLGWQLVFLPVAVAVVGVMAWRGMLSQRALDRGPTRDLDLRPLEATAGALLAAVTVLLMTVSASILEPWGLAALAGPLQMLGLVGLIGVFFSLFFRPAMVEGGYRKIGLVPRRPWRDVAVAALAVPVAVILAGGLTILFMLIGQLIGLPAPTDAEAGHQTLVTLQQSTDLAEILEILIFAALIAPIIEELCFRGVMQTSLLALGGTDRRWFALAMTATIFGLIHYSALTSWHGIPALIGLGLVFGYVYERTGSLLCCILVHAGFNAWNLGLVLASRG